MTAGIPAARYREGPAPILAAPSASGILKKPGENLRCDITLEHLSQKLPTGNRVGFQNEIASCIILQQINPDDLATDRSF